MHLASLTTSSSLSLPQNSYIYKILPVGTTLAAISSDDSLHIVDPVTLQKIPNGVFSNVHTGVTCLENVEADGNIVLTAGRDGLVRCWDLRAGQKVLQFSDDSNTTACLSLACRSSTVAVGTEFSSHQASVLLWERSFPTKPIRQYIESHNDDVTELAFHPHDPHTLLSGSTDGLVNIYSTAHTDEDDALIQVANHGSSINHAGFLSDSHFYALSHDEKFSIYEFDRDGKAASDEPPVVFGDLRSMCECEYVVDVLPMLGGRGAVLGAGSHSRQRLDLIPLRHAFSWDLDAEATVRLPGGHGEEIIRSMVVDNGSSCVFTAGEDGMVRAWRMPEGESVAEATPVVDAEMGPKKKKKKEERDDGDGKGRFRPY